MSKRGGASSRGASGDMTHKRNQLFAVVKQQKLDTLRWLLVHGGVNVNTRDEEEHTALQVAAVMGKDKALDVIVGYIKRGGEASDMDTPDDEGRTPLMMAAAKGHFMCCKYLIDNGCKLSLKDETGKTARDYAVARKQDNIVKYIDGDKDEEEEEGEDVPDDGFMTSTQRSKAKKREMQAKEGLVAAAVERRKGGDSDDEKEEEKKKLEAAAVPAPEPKWEEVKKVMAEGLKDLTISRQNDTSPDSDTIDMAIFYTSINRLQLRMPQGKLTVFPADIGRLNGMLTLILSFNSLKELPDAIGDLKHLKHFEAEGNEIAALPKTMGKLAALEVLNLASNQLQSEALESLKGLTNITSLHLDGNKLTSLQQLQFKKMGRLNDLSARNNQIEDVPASIGHLADSLININLAENKLTELPKEMGDLKEKKLMTYNFDENPFTDPKLRRLLPKGKKDLLQYLRKLKPTKKKSDKDKKKKKKEESEEEEDDEEEEEGAEGAAASGKPWPLGAKPAEAEEEESD